MLRVFWCLIGVRARCATRFFGIFEGLVEPGEAVRAGDPVARLWFPDTPGRAPEVLPAPLDGVLACIRAIPATEAGDGAFTLGQPIDPAELA